MTIQPRQVVYGAAIAAGLTAGAFGIASAASTQTTTGPTTPTSVAPTTVPAGDTKDPGVSSSVTVPDQAENQDGSGADSNDSAADPNESAALAAAAKITEQQARDTAGAAAGGTATKASLDNENGSVAWSVEVTRADKTTVDVKIDASTGAVLSQDSFNEADGEKSGQPDTDNVDHQDRPDNESNDETQSGSQSGGGQ